MNDLMATVGLLLLGGLIQYLISNFLKLASADVDLLADQVDQVSRLEAYAIEYWQHDAASDSAKDKLLASLVNGSMTASSFFEKDAKRIMKGSYSKYEELDGELFDLVTGGAYETSTKTSDPERITKIIAKCNETRALLRSSKRRIFGAR